MSTPTQWVVLRTAQFKPCHRQNTRSEACLIERNVQGYSCYGLYQFSQFSMNPLQIGDVRNLLIHRDPLLCRLVYFLSFAACNIRLHPWNWQDSCTLACLGSSVWMFHMSDLTKAEKCLENLSGRDESHAHHPLEEVGYGTSLSVFWKRAGRVPLLLFLGHIYLFYLMYITVIVWCLELTMTWLSSDHLKDFLR